uniref:BZIP domain-containing protein n=1 Tax=Globisporangium ultimum (strain ATCC 200006 / CBS 805.95 / DAOM BR144) TaxID=431595 RepID=K3XC40_GLOUD
MDSDNESEMIVDPELVRELLVTGSAEEIVAEQNARTLLARRQRRRVNMARYRHRKKVGIEEMQHEEQVLLAQLHATVHAHTSQTSEVVSPARAQSPEIAMKLDAFVDLVTEKEQLRQENTALRKQWTVFTKFQQMLREESELFANGSIDTELMSSSIAARSPRSDNTEDESKAPPSGQVAHHASDNDAGNGYWVQLDEDDDNPFFYIPYDEQESRMLVNSMRQRIFEFQTQNENPSFQSRAQVVSLFDWTVHLLFEWDENQQVNMLRYTFSKTFRNPMRSLEELVDLEWRVFHDPKLYDDIHSGKIKSRVMQSFDADQMSLRVWNAPSADQSLKVRVLGLHSRGSYRDPAGRDGQLFAVLALLPKGLPLSSTSTRPSCSDGGSEDGGDGVASDQASEEDPVMWFTSNGFIYTHYCANQLEPGAIDVEYGGKIQILDEEHGRFYMVDLGTTLLRLENLLLPFRVLPSSSDGG